MADYWTKDPRGGVSVLGGPGSGANAGPLVHVVGSWGCWLRGQGVLELLSAYWWMELGLGVSDCGSWSWCWLACGLSWGLTQLDVGSCESLH